jgi:hypothetical protein
MKTTRALLYTFLALLFISLAGPRALAQDAEPLPPGLSQSSSLPEVLDWLNKNGFTKARIGLEGYRLNTLSVSDVAGGDSPLPSESPVFAPGFKLVSVDGCRLRLRNGGITVLRTGRDGLEFDPGRLSLYRGSGPALTPDPADLYIWLDRLRPRGETPYLHTKSQDKGRTFGWWRTKFKAKRTRSPDIVVLEIPERQPGGYRENVYADKVSFTFDDIVSSEQFYQAFGRAIRLCSGK